MSTTTGVSSGALEAVGFVRAVAQAEDYIAAHPAEARAVAIRLLNYDEPFISANWPEHQFALSLDQSLVTAVEDEARWMIANNLTDENQVPDFPD